MKTTRLLKLGLVVSLLTFLPNSYSQAPPAGGASQGDSAVIEAENRVEKMPAGATEWQAAKTNDVLKAKDRFRTGFKSRATLRLSNQGILRVSQLTTLEIQPPTDATKEQSVLDLKSGTAYFFNRDRPVETQFKTPQASGAIRGTEFNLEVDELSGRTVVTMLNGAVDLTNPLGQVSLAAGEQGIVDPGQAPRKTAVIDAVNIIQWSLYYPGVLDVAELGLSDAETSALQDSLSAYRNGDLLQALASYPTNRLAASSKELVYSAALQLAVGQVKEAEALLAKLGAADAAMAPFADALRQLIAAVKFQTWNRAQPPTTATEWMAESYYQQSRSKLEEARRAARNAAEKSPQFGFARSRLAEMEFSFGRTAEALTAVEKSLEISPRNAQAMSLKGYLLAAQNRIKEAMTYFDQAIGIDGGLGNAWLGRGLCRIRQGDRAAGRQELQVAATLEPHRAVLRSYLAKAYSNEGDLRRAREEIDLAKKYDPNDPTAFLYSALMAQEHNQINEGVRDLEKSKELNDNRSVFRSRLLLDQDRAVRSANLAAIYRDNGMLDLSAREASRAVNSDYANHSAHLFLANSYDELRDPSLANLRYETPWFSELLLANLLAPVGAGSLSQNVSQQEYSKLFERDRLGVSSSTEYLSRGAWSQQGSQFGTFGNASYALDANYRSENGQRPNADFEGLFFSGKFKQQLTPQDSLFFQATYYDFEAGDVGQRYDQSQFSLTQRVTEKQDPFVFAGYHREWSPGVHTLLLASRFSDTFTRLDPANTVLVTTRVPVTPGNPSGLNRGTNSYDLNFRSEFEGYSTELQQIWQQPSQTLVLGGRYQVGWSETDTVLSAPPGGSTLPAQLGVETDLQRWNLYGYHQWSILENLQLTTGLSYDSLEYPANTEIAPIASAQAERDRFSPKAGLLWSPWKNTHVRGFYARSLGGVFYDTSVRIEPVQVAGFTQAYRSLIPESEVGLIPGTRFTTTGIGLDHQFQTGTYLGLEGELLESDANRTVGYYDRSLSFPINPATGRLTEKYVATGVGQQFDYREKSIIITVNQLVAQEWSLGARYKLSEADLNTRFVADPNPVFLSNLDVAAVLHQLRLYAIFNHRCGFFSMLQALWSSQSNQGYTSDIPGDDFWHLDFFVGYRFPRRMAEVRLGVLNLTDEDYHLNPLNLHAELPRARTIAARLRFNF